MKSNLLVVCLICFPAIFVQANDEAKVKFDKETESLSRMICKNQFLQAAVEKKYRPVFQKLTIAVPAVEDLCTRKSSEVVMDCLVKAGKAVSPYEKTKFVAKFEAAAAGLGKFCATVAEIEAAEVISAILSDAVKKKVTIEESAKQFAEANKAKN